MATRRDKGETNKRFEFVWKPKSDYEVTPEWLTPMLNKHQPDSYKVFPAKGVMLEFIEEVSVRKTRKETSDD